jgi:acetolactate synthase-1/2/3 large subunit
MCSYDPPAAPTGEPTADGVCAVVGACLPENAIVCDEGITTGRNIGQFLQNAAPHDFMSIMGGSIGWGLPAGTGAALAAPDRKVFVLEGDGSAFYTHQALWTMARESLDVTMLICANRAYRILQSEFKNVGAGQVGHRARDMLTLDRPYPDWLAISKGFGVEAGRATNLEELARELKRGFAASGPYLIELLM